MPPQLRQRVETLKTNREIGGSSTFQLPNALHLLVLQVFILISKGHTR